MKVNTSLTLFFLALALYSTAQAQPAPWNNRKCAVVLTYDDALNVHLDNVMPALDSLGLKGTFYLTAYAPGSKDRIADWKRAAVKGHELGNHTLYHPCTGNRPGREWVSEERDLGRYSMQRILEEIRMTNVYLQALDGKTKRTFAYPCGDMAIGDSLYSRHIKSDFTAARGVAQQMYAANNMSAIDLYNVGGYAVVGHPGEYLTGLVKEAIQNKKLLVFIFHGVGGEHNLNVDLAAHRQLLLVSAVLFGTSGTVALISGIDVPGKVVWAVLAAVLPAATTAIAAYEGLFAFERVAKLYRDAARNLRRVAPPIVGDTAAADAAVTAYVAEVERIFERERGQWGQLSTKASPPPDEPH
jgi:sialate O-acetylesterase